MTAPTGKTRGRPPGLPKVAGSGRKKGSLDKSSRLLISEQLAFDILKTYQRLGPDWLFKVAQERPDLFINQCLSKLLPPAFKDDPDIQVNTQINVNNLTEMEAARRVAYALAKAVDQQGDITSQHAPVMTPQRACDWQNPRGEISTPLLEPEPTVDPDKERWIEELPLTEEQRRNNQLARQTHGVTLESYRGSDAQQGLGPVQRQPASTGKPSVNEIHRRMRNRRELL